MTKNANKVIFLHIKGQQDVEPLHAFRVDPLHQLRYKDDQNKYLLSHSNVVRLSLLHRIRISHKFHHSAVHERKAHHKGCLSRTKRHHIKARVTRVHVEHVTRCAHDMYTCYGRDPCTSCTRVRRGLCKSTSVRKMRLCSTKEKLFKRRMESI